MLMADKSCSGSWGAAAEFGPGEEDNLTIGYEELMDLIEEAPGGQPDQGTSNCSSFMASRSVPRGGTHNDSQSESFASRAPDIGNHDLFNKTSNGNFGAPEYRNVHTEMPFPSSDFSVFQDRDSSFGDNVSTFGDPPWLPMYGGHGSFSPINQGSMIDEEDEMLRFPIHSPYSTSNLPFDAMGCSSKYEDQMLPNNGNYVLGVQDVAPEQPCQWPQLSLSIEKDINCMKDEKFDSIFSVNDSVRSSGVTDGPICEENFGVADGKAVWTKDFMQGSSLSINMVNLNDTVFEKVEDDAIANASKRARYAVDTADGLTTISSTYNVSEQSFAYAQPFRFGEKHVGCSKSESSSTLTKPNNIASRSSSFSPESTESSSIDCRSRGDDDPDICIIEEMSHPAPTPQSVAPGNELLSDQGASNNLSLYDNGVGSTPRPRSNAEQLIFRAALQDLSQPKSEETPPDGSLAVPLLRHQKIALSWMVKKETAINCCGGILADDQGLGKTVSTIALILKERPPTFKQCQENPKQELQTFDLDEDENVDGAPKLNNAKLGRENFQAPPSGSSLARGRGRPAAGTLVVCPTSVLRQWAEELHNKVTSAATLSVLVYHGGNRTKDPLDLAKYDVVLTTYSIVSMEVPKQPLVDKDDDEKGRPADHDLPPAGLISGKRKKDAFNHGKKRSKNGKKMENELLESIAGPLSKVGWFRVVLDEAQSIKNHRTQVARACWGLRAKRRWCLSGTPIQNAIDDLYSYFRFLRFDPYAVYKTFILHIKTPIQRSPARGYKKLQAILKTIMLRRTKGTLLDGEPIINLPPKLVELKKVEFSKEERDFYSKLEADSRAQFQEYAAAGTVRENYVNILLMLLRLRQACDHPLLVRGYDLGSPWQSLEMAKKLPQERRVFLLNCLEASLAICSICNDPPEEAVVSVCGHVFCNQCLCEHLTGDDGHCPATKCKERLSMSQVFSGASLKSSIVDNCAQNSHPSNLGSELLETVDPRSWGHLHDSSKIKAALEVLQALSKTRDGASRNSDEENSSNVGSSYSDETSPPRNICKDNSSEGNVSVEKGPGLSNKPAPEKAIVFSQWTRMLDLLEGRLKDSSIQYRRLDGTMSVHARDKAVKDFNTQPEVTVMIMSLKAASLGLNMVSACHVLLLDLWWNPTTEDQAVDRAHRIGQTRPVTVLRLTVKDTVEDRILDLQQKKRLMVASAFGEDEKAGRQTRLTVEDLNYLFMA
ncbi:hypothetical protein EUGRSUZ_D00684 [Eucalyptus grandis]|uniref:Uncharacterized protein n=2 Tax=Eucalyptus grandis TaxID=71139 RepID=A0ACC3L3D2_EUCGR|nr:hypothetical protein EUGRSUZ_D00684 [Eucalyptus grandis]